MNILITGGAGFIGSHLAEMLLKKGHSVAVFDDLSTGSRANIAHLLSHKQFFFKKGSVLFKKDLEPLVKRAHHMYHLAAAVGVKYIMEHPLQTIITNVEGTKNVLDLAAKRKIPTLITSSSEVYGKNDHLPFREDADRTYGSAYSERWGYALSKALDECLALAYWRERKLPVVVVRLFNTVGPRQSSSYGMVIPTLIKQALAREPLTVFGTGNQTRCFSHVHDIATAMAKLLNTKQAYGEIVNLGSTESVSIRDLAEKIKLKTKSKSKIIMVPYKKAYSDTFEDMQKRLPDVAKAKKLIGYKPTYTLDQIISSIL
jgi:UDP-glucose 4-epimerase